MKSEASLETLTLLFKLCNNLIGDENIKIIFEFGARYGEDTVQFAIKYPHATIYTFECNPNTLPICKQNISEFKNIILTERAVSDQDGEISFFSIDKEKTITSWEDGNQGASSLFKASKKYPVENYVQKEIKVESITLKTFMKNNDIENIDILWMDIQGAELLALKGLENKLNNVKIIHLEVEFLKIYLRQPLFQNVKKFFKNKEFSFLGFTSKNIYSADAVFANNNYCNFKENGISLIKEDNYFIKEIFFVWKLVKKLAKKIN